MASNGEISKITIPNPSGNGTLTYDIKDAVARAAVTSGLTFHIATNAATTPYGISWDNGGTVVTGSLVASSTTTGFYLVPASHTQTKDAYAEYVAVLVSTNPDVFAWEKIGDTEIDFSNLSSYLDTAVTPTSDEVLGSGTTFTNSTSSVTFAGGTNDTFVKSYPGVTSKLSTTTITGVSGSTTASAATAGTARAIGNADVGSSITCAKVASVVTSVSYIGNSSTTSVLQNASVSNETLTLGAVSVSQGSVIGTDGTETFTPATSSNDTITPYTFSDVTVPIAAESATTVATGSLSSEATGAAVMTGLGTATTASAVTDIGAGTAAAQTITVGSNDKVDALTNITVAVVDKNS